jgi:hypothetical protein
MGEEFRLSLYEIFLIFGYRKKKTAVNKHRSRPLRPNEYAVPVFSAMAPNGTALSGMMPKVIIAMLTTRPRISVEE